MFFPLGSFGRRRRGRTAATCGRATLPRRLVSSAPVIAALFVVAGMLGPFAAAAHAATTQAVVSLTFDDGDEDQYTNAFPVLQQHGLHGTFYIITGFVGVNSGNMTRSQLQSLYNAGNEIGGHTVLHPDLAEVSASEATREICDGRNTLLKWGFPVTDFAYPYANINSTLTGIAQRCGFNSARGLGQLETPYGCRKCAPAESIPSATPYDLNAPGAVTDQWTLSDLESVVTQAESSGGWVPITFHNICNNDCDPYSVSPSLFSSFIQWLSAQPVSVKTVRQVVGGSVHPAVSAPQVSPAAPGANGVVNPSLETVSQYASRVPYCWTHISTGTSTASFAETSDAHTGSVAETVTVSSYSSGEARLITTQDLGQCAPAAVSGDHYSASAWYHSTVPTQFAFWYRDTTGGWHYWTASPHFPASSGWTRATWTTPTVPAGATALSFGLQIGAVGTLTTDDYSLIGSASSPASPAVSLTSPSHGVTLYLIAGIVAVLFLAIVIFWLLRVRARRRSAPSAPPRGPTRPSPSSPSGYPPVPPPPANEYWGWASQSSPLPPPRPYGTPPQGPGPTADPWAGYPPPSRPPANTHRAPAPPVSGPPWAPYPPDWQDRPYPPDRQDRRDPRWIEESD